MVPSISGDPGAEYAAVRQGVGLIDRSDADVLEVTGRDRVTFLHAMLSNDIKALAGAGVPARRCSTSTARCRR
jgi:folate-binding Fe-S cluster repair protein YgfZ